MTQQNTPISLAASTYWRDCCPNASHAVIDSRAQSAEASSSSRPSSSSSCSIESSIASSLETLSNRKLYTNPDTFFKTIRWTADGTTLILSSSSNTISAHVVPTDLLSSSNPSPLETHSTISLPSSTNILEPASYFSLDDPSTQLILVATKDSPIHIYHAFPPASSVPYPPLASYKLIRRETEAYLQPMSALWTCPGTHFLVGTMNRLDYFDVSRTGSSGPLMTIHTIPSRRHISKGGGVGMKGMVSALDMSTDNNISSCSLLAAGTWTRWISMYDLARSNHATSTWCIKDVAQNEFGIDNTEAGGSGIMQVKWSPCGRYLIINERQAGGLLVYDIRGTGRPLNYLPRPRDHTSQRVECDVYQNSRGGFEIWAADQQGGVSVWEDVSQKEGIVKRSWGWQAHDCAVGSVVMHSSGSVVATCGGEWQMIDDSEVAERNSGYTRIAKRVGRPGIKIWRIGSSSNYDDDTEAEHEQSTEEAWSDECSLRPAV